MQHYGNARQIVSIEADTGVFLPAAGQQPLFLIEHGRPAFLGGLEAYHPLIFWTYLCGMLIVAAVSFRAYQKIFRVKRHATALPANWQYLVAQTAKRIRVAPSVSIRMSKHIDIPVVIGFFKPMVLLPAAMLFSMTTEQVESIVMHELYHIRRLDHLINMIQHLFEILLFYHPAIWWMSKTTRQLREESVDEWVVSQIVRPADYAKALVELEQNRKAGMPQPMVAATQSKNHLFTRIKHMMTMKTRSLNTGQKMATALAFILAFATVAWVKPAIPDQLGFTAFENQAYDPAAPIGLGQYTEVEQAPDTPPLPPEHLAKAETGMISNPTTLYLEDGTEIEFEGLSKKDREKIKTAMEELQLALQQIPDDIFEEIDSEEFREEMQQARKEIAKAMQELNAVDWDSLIQEVGKAVSIGMEAFHKGMEAFHEGMKIMNEEMQDLGPALEEMFKELEKEFQRKQDESGQKDN